MTLLDAKQYDPMRDRRKRNRILAIVLLVLLLAGLGWWFRNWPEERAVDHFFDALQQKDYESAYGLWWNDPQWKQHQQKYAQYPYNEFYRDWGPGGEWGLVKSHRVHGSANPRGGSGVIVEVIVNERAEHARVWVQKSDKTLSFSPY
ncbi:MAG: hypothetical protein NVS1B11_10430 [Terriglobales bacterium]